MVSGATYWTKWVSVSPEPLNEAPTVCQALGPTRRQLTIPALWWFYKHPKSRVSRSEVGPLGVEHPPAARPAHARSPSGCQLLPGAPCVRRGEALPVLSNPGIT